MGDPIRSCGRKRKCRASSHRKADHRNLVVVERIDDAREIAGEVAARISRGVIGRIALTVAALVVSDDRVAIRQFSPLVKPHALSARQPVHEDQRLAAAGDAVGKLDIAEANAAREVSDAHQRGWSSYRSRTRS